MSLTIRLAKHLWRLNPQEGTLPSNPGGLCDINRRLGEMEDTRNSSVIRRFARRFIMDSLAS
jgi:hypothetical protein